jgi:hypothetical protein
MTADVLREARALVQRGWTQRWFAKDAIGRRCHSDNPLAACWCASGALGRASGLNSVVYSKAIAALNAVVGDVGIAAWNDEPDRTQDEVLAAFSRAIERAESVS